MHAWPVRGRVHGRIADNGLGMETIDRAYFADIYRLVNSDEYSEAKGGGVRPEILDARDLPWNHTNLAELGLKAVQLVKKTGTCLVHFDASAGYDRVFDWQQSVFGSYRFDSSVASKPFSEIVAKEDGKYFANTHFAQPMHSDEAHTADPPRVISLYCRKQSQQGGVSTLVNIHAWLKTLADMGDIDSACFAMGALQINGARGALNRPLLVLDHTDVLCPFPSILREATGDEKVISLYRDVMAWAHQTENQMRFRMMEGQLLLIDNYKVLHGRTGFRLDDPRMLLRACFGSQALQST